MRRLTIAGWALLACTALAWTSDVILFLQTGAGRGGQPVPFWYVLIWAGTWLAFAAIGGLIVVLRPANRIGWFLVGIGFLQGISSAWGSAIHLLYVTPSWHHAAAWLLLLMTPTSPLAFFLVVEVLLRFPDGALPSRRWRWVERALAVVVVAVVADSLITPTPPLTGLPASPLANPAIARVLDPLTSFNLVAIFFAIAAAAIVVRYRRGGPVLRQQVKWFGLGALVLVLCLAVNGVGSAVAPQSDVQSPLVAFSNFLEFVGLVSVPAAIAIAILRHRLYDIDLIISRGLAYGALAAAATALYIGVVVGLGALVGRTAGRDLFLSLVATAIIAVLFQPLRLGLQRAANRLVYGRRQTPYDSLAGFTRHLAESYSIERVLPRMAQALGEGIRGRAASVTLGNGSGPRVGAAWPDGAPLPVEIPDHSVEVAHAGEHLGTLALWSHQGEGLNATERRLLLDLAQQAGLVFHNASLTVELEQRLEELQASRLRLVTAQDAERRRFERDLHDGAQQGLVALRMKLGRAEALTSGSCSELATLIREVGQDTAETLETIRRLGRGLFPPLLESQGLASALTAHARRLPLPVEVSASSDRFGRELEAAVYFSCVEALQNVARHAGASHAWLSIEDRKGRLTFEVRDDGRGFDPAKPASGSGLENIHDRVEALGGSICLRSGSDGTSLGGSVPTRPTQPT
jgi:signal transduction histidine kinase